MKEERFEKVVENEADLDIIKVILLAPLITLLYPMLLIMILILWLKNRKVYWRRVYGKF